MRGRQLCLFAAAASFATLSTSALAPALARAGSFTVAACDAAPGGAHSSWNPQAGSVDVFKICPSSNLHPFGGIGTRLAGRTFRGGEYSRQWFYSPPGTTITGITWSGGFSHSCTGGVWANQLRAQGRIDSVLIGTSPGALCQPSQDLPARFLATPSGTTRLLQNTQCGATSCPSSGAAFRTRYASVVINDPAAPALTVTGGGLSGAHGWVRGAQELTLSAADTTGIKLVRMQIANYRGAVESGTACNYTTTTPCSAGNGGRRLAFRTTELSDGPHTVTVTAYDAASNPSIRTATVRVDNEAPPAPQPVLEGGSDWRASNAYTLRWRSPESASPTRAPLTAVRYRVCPAGSSVGCPPERLVGELFPSDVNPKAPGEGEFEVRVALVDAAGNGRGGDARWSEPILLRYDPDVAQLRAGVATTRVRRTRVRVRGRQRVVRRRVVRLVGTKRVRFGKRFEVRGRLTTRSGQPRVNTAIGVYGRSNRIGAPESHLGSVTTDTGGRFVYRAEARQSHTLRFTRRASTATVEIRVPARVTLRGRPRSVINGESVTFSGRVYGPMPPGGKQVVLQAYSRGKWRTFQLFRTDVRGRYRRAYRFDGTSGRVVYPLRAVVTKEPTFEYERGFSKPIKVAVRGL